MSSVHNLGCCAFACHQDADSLDPVEGRKKEGAFYVWTAAEIEEVLGSGKNGPRLEVFKEVYGVKPKGDNSSLHADADLMSKPSNSYNAAGVLLTVAFACANIECSNMCRCTLSTSGIGL